MTARTFVLAGEDLKAPFAYRGCGLDDIYLLNGYEVHETEYGTGYSIVDQDGLLASIAKSLIAEKRILSGKEVRYLRVRMNLTQSELARMMGMSVQQVARWEKNQSEIPGPADRLLRILAAQHGGGNVDVRELLWQLDESGASSVAKPVFGPVPKVGWRQAA